MRTLFFTLTMLSIISCESPTATKQNYMSISILRDVTDYHQLQPDADAVLSLFDLADNKDHSVSFKYSEITDKTLVPSTSLRLTNTSETDKKNRNNEPMFREKIILQFFDTVRKTLMAPLSIKDSAKSLSHSECFKSISKELSLISRTNSEHKIVWVFSNLQENSSILSVFDEKTRELLNRNPKAIEATLEQAGLLPTRLDQITIVFSYLPSDREDDQRFNSMVSVYKNVLEKHGAYVQVQATNRLSDYK